MTRAKTWMLVAVALLAAGPAGAAGKVDRKAVVEANNAFALDLYGRLSQQEGNLFFSPYSISTALAMTYAGARGDTEKQMAKALHFGANDAAFHAVMGRLAAELEASKATGCEVSIANALWAQKGYRFLKSFSGLVSQSYQAPLSLVDFGRATEQARRTINTWVEKETRNKIKELLKKGILTPLTRLVLTNAIYFKGDWASQFDKKKTRDAPFHLGVPRGYRGPVRAVTAPTMHQKGDFRYAETKDVQALELPYKGTALSMVVLMPKAYHTEKMAALEKSLSPKTLGGWVGRLRKRKVLVFLPKFKMTSEFRLEKALSGLGMVDAFTKKANFSGMTGTSNLYISAVVHKAFVDVNEEGTEAAAATAVVMNQKSVQRHPVFRADRPFLFLIRDNRTGSILFLGRVTNPK